MRSLYVFFFLLNSLLLTAQPQSVIEEIDAFIQGVIMDDQAPSLSVAIVRGDKILLSKGYGFRDVENQLAADEHTLYAIGSTTKAMTALAVCQLAAEGAIELDRPLVNYLPSFRLYDPYASEHMTPRDLLCHRSGLPRHDLAWYGSGLSRREIFERLPHLPPSRGFREAFQYQNIMFMTAGLLIEEVSGESWEAYLAENIFDPLGMDRANTSVEDSKVEENAALPYGGAGNLIPFRNIDAIGPAGSVNASARDMARWLQMQIGRGSYDGEVILPEAWHRETIQPSMVVPADQGEWKQKLLFDNAGAPVSYGLGWFLSSHRGHALVSHGGSIDGFRAEVAFLPEREIGIAVMVNHNPSILPQIVRNYVFDRLLELPPADWREREERIRTSERKNDPAERPVPNTNPAHPLRDYLGEYEHPGYGKIDIRYRNQQLQLIFRDFEIPLEHFHYEVFSLESGMFSDQKVVFQTGVDGKVKSISMTLEPQVAPITFDRKNTAQTQAAPDRLAEWQKYTGIYTVAGAELEVKFKNANALLIEIPLQGAFELSPVSDNIFSLVDQPAGQVEFLTDAEGSGVSELILKQRGEIFRAKKVERP
ncbi:MAG: serine hydrolase [Saprospiraceae bacterium]|nr:serine hydrolase [Saprospiraceae bacterium]